MDGRTRKTARNKGVVKTLINYVLGNVKVRFGAIGMLGYCSPKTLPSAHILGLKSEEKMIRNRQRIDLLDTITMKKIGTFNQNVIKLTRKETFELFENHLKYKTELYPLDLQNNIIGNSLFKGYYILKSNHSPSIWVGCGIWQSSLVHTILKVGENINWPPNCLENNNGFNTLFGHMYEGSSEECENLFKILFSHLAFLTCNEPAKYNMDDGVMKICSVAGVDALHCDGVCPNFLLSWCLLSWKFEYLLNDWSFRWDDILVAYNSLDLHDIRQPSVSVPLFLDPRDLINCLCSTTLCSL